MPVYLRKFPRECAHVSALAQVRLLTRVCSCKLSRAGVLVQVFSCQGARVSTLVQVCSRKPPPEVCSCKCARASVLAQVCIFFVQVCWCKLPRLSVLVQVRSRLFTEEPFAMRSGKTKRGSPSKQPKGILKQRTTQPCQRKVMTAPGSSSKSSMSS